MNDKMAWERFVKTGRIDDYLCYIGIHSNIELFSVKDGTNADKDPGICPQTTEYR